MNYDYYTEMYSDIKDYIATEEVDLSKYEDIEEANEALYDILFEESSITGNGPSDYYASQYECESYLCHNFDLACEACIDSYVDMQALLDHFEKGDLPEFLDCIIRCDLLREVLYQVLWEYFNKNESKMQTNN